MMNWKVKMAAANNESLKLEDIAYENISIDEDCIDVCFNICGMSDNLTVEVKKAIEKEKIKCTEELEDSNKKGAHWNTKWSDKPVVKDFEYLNVVFKSGEPIDYKICIIFHDAEDESLEVWDCEVAVDLSENVSEIKKIIIKTLINKFF